MARAVPMARRSAASIGAAGSETRTSQPDSGLVRQAAYTELPLLSVDRCMPDGVRVISAAASGGRVAPRGTVAIEAPSSRPRASNTAALAAPGRRAVLLSLCQTRSSMRAPRT